MTDTLPPMSEDKKLMLVKNAITTKAGWQVLAQSVLNAINNGATDAKEKCIELLRKIAGDKEVDMPVGLKNGEQASESMGDIVAMEKVKFADLLIQKLEDNLVLVDNVKEEK